MLLKYYKSSFFLVTLVFFTYQTSLSQKFDVMSAEEKAAFNKQAISKIKELEFRFQKITNLIDYPDIQKDLIKSTLRDFEPDATIEVAGQSAPNGKPWPISQYLREKVARYKRKYNIVSVSFISFETEEIRRDPENPRQYIIEFSFLQRWCAEKDGLPQRDAEGLLKHDYCDTTKKTGKFTIKKVQTFSGSKWKLFYSSIDAQLQSIERG